MKKTICIILAVILCIGAWATSAFAFTEIKYGSVDGDAVVSAEDARLILRRSVSIESFNIYQSKAADLDFDGEITAADARACLRMSVNLDTLKAVSDVDILLHGNSYYVSCEMTNESGSTPFETAKNGNSFIFSIPFDTNTFSYLKNDSGRFIVYNSSFVPLTEAVMRLLGVDSEISALDGTLSSSTSVFANMLNGYEESKTIMEVDADMIPRNKTVITGEAGSYTVVYETADGQLMSIESFNSRGTSTNKIVFNITTSFIPDGLMDTRDFSQNDIIDLLLKISENTGLLDVLNKLNFKK